MQMNFDSNMAEVKPLLAGMAKEAAELKQAAGGSITDSMADWLAPQYLLAARQKLGSAEGSQSWEVLRQMVHDWALLRRGDHSAARLQLEREELELQRANSQTQKEKEFCQWIENPEVREKYKEYFPDPSRCLTPELLRQIEEAAKIM